jgi:hypothetical protein
VKKYTSASFLSRSSVLRRRLMTTTAAAMLGGADGEAQH